METIKERSELVFDLPPDWTNSTTIDNYFDKATKWTEQNYPDHIKWLRSLSTIIITKEYFWREYIWCSLVSGFNAKMVSRFYDRFLNVVGIDPIKANHNVSEIFQIFGNKNKVNGILKCADMISAHGWDAFYSQYIEPKNIGVLQGLPNVGPVISHHLARNLGIDTVKPDLHLNRLATRFNYNSPFEMCSNLAVKYKVALVGEVDLKLFLYSQCYGTTHLK